MSNGLISRRRRSQFHTWDEIWRVFYMFPPAMWWQALFPRKER